MRKKLIQPATHPTQIPPLEVAMLVAELGGPEYVELLFASRHGDKGVWIPSPSGKIYEGALTLGATVDSWRVYGVRKKQSTLFSGNQTITDGE